MDAELIFAEDVEVCPKCGSSEFWENRIIWVGDDPADEELASIECKVCGAVFYARDYYRRRFGKLEDDDEEYQKARDAILEFAKGSHRARELGLLE